MTARGPSFARLLGAALLGSLVSACGGSAGPEVVIQEHRSARLPSREVVLGANTLERFQGAGQRGSMPSDDMGSANPIDYDLPEGWRVLPPTSDRLLNLRPAGDPEASCYLSFLQGPAGGLAANVNRWRGQFGAEPLSEDAVNALPTFSMLGRAATLVDVQGVFSGMAGPMAQASAPRADFALLGLLVSEPAGSIFLKFTGPAPLVAKENDAFLGLARSLRVSEPHGAAPRMPSGGASVGAPMGAPMRGGALAWEPPAGWSQTGARPMREVTFDIGDGGECYIARLPGAAGGLRDNLDRWCKQFGQAPLSNDAYAALPLAEVLGSQVPVLELDGSFTGMDGTTQSHQGLLAVACIREHESVFVKLTGPTAIVHAQRANFLAFLASLAEGK